MTSELRVVVCNCPPDAAEAIARHVLAKRLAACVNVIDNVRSLYWWDDEIESDGETTLLIKTRAALVADLTTAIREKHPYEVPEIISLPIAANEGSPEYLAWLVRETRG